MRDIVVVIDRMIGAIPDDNSLVRKLQSTRSSALYTAAALQGGYWRSLASLLGSEIGTGSLQFGSWEAQVRDIFNGVEL